MKKRIVCLALALIMGFSAVPVYAQGISVIVNKNPVTFSADASPVIINSRTMIPLRGVFEQLGFAVSWDSETKTAKLISDEIKISVTANNEVFYRNDIALHAEVPAQIINGRMYLPLRAIGEAADMDVNWDAETKTVYLGEGYVPAESENTEKEENLQKSDIDNKAKDEDGISDETIIEAAYQRTDSNGIIDWSIITTDILTDKDDEECERDLKIVANALKNRFPHIEKANQELLEIVSSDMSREDKIDAIHEFGSEFINQMGLFVTITEAIMSPVRNEFTQEMMDIVEDADEGITTAVLQARKNKKNGADEYIQYIIHTDEEVTRKLKELEPIDRNEELQQLYFVTCYEYDTEYFKSLTEDEKELFFESMARED